MLLGAASAVTNRFLIVEFQVGFEQRPELTVRVLLRLAYTDLIFVSNADLQWMSTFTGIM